MERKSKKTKKKLSNDILEWDVGYREGPMLEEWYKKWDEKHNSVEEGDTIAPTETAKEPKETVSQRKRPRVHPRRAHWHHYRVGKGRSQIRLRWISPIIVNGSDKNSDMPVILHEAEGDMA